MHKECSNSCTLSVQQGCSLYKCVRTWALFRYEFCSSGSTRLCPIKLGSKSPYTSVSISYG